MERYQVRGGGATVLALSPGDALEVIDPQGCQVCELSAFDDSGRADPALLGAGAGAAALGTTQILSDDSEDARRVAAGLQRRNIDFKNALAAHLFASDSAAGEKARFTAQADLTCVIAAPDQLLAGSFSNGTRLLPVRLPSTCSPHNSARVG